MKQVIRKGCKDMWNAFMVADAKFCGYDIPFCPTTAKDAPLSIIDWKQAETIYRRQLRKGKKDFFHNAFVCFYLDDSKFDGKNGIWFRYKYVECVMSHFAGVVTPDFSTNADFPIPWKIFNTYRMRAYGYWLGTKGHQVINNVRWGGRETWRYCFEGIPKRSVVCIGTVGSGLRLLKNRPLFEAGLKELVRVLKPHTVIIYGSADYKPLDYLRENGIEILQYDSATNTRLKGRGEDE